jgi:hypothetical protein
LKPSFESVQILRTFAHLHYHPASVPLADLCTVPFSRKTRALCSMCRPPTGPSPRLVTKRERMCASLHLHSNRFGCPWLTLLRTAITFRLLSAVLTTHTDRAKVCLVPTSFTCLGLHQCTIRCISVWTEKWYEKAAQTWIFESPGPGPPGFTQKKRDARLSPPAAHSAFECA